tara:strand:- start:8141 stop:9097 length:957 start_codon:yes stop_codon:yes gene_type:complete
MESKFSIITTKKQGHYKSYGDLFGSLIKDNFEVSETFRLIRDGFISETLILIDGDSQHLFLFPVALVRTILGKKTIFFSVRTEDLFGSRLKSRVKLGLVRLISMLPYQSYASIHKPEFSRLEGKLLSVVFYDPQLWDLKVANVKRVVPDELVGAKCLGSAILIIGALTSKRCENELLEAVEKCSKQEFVFAGKMSEQSRSVLSGFTNVKIVNRYLLDEEIFALYGVCRAVYAYYDFSVNRPSGILGRALQLNKYVIVRSGGYLHRNFSEYPNIIAISSLLEIQDEGFRAKLSSPPVSFDASQYDDEKKLTCFLTDEKA